MLSSIQEIDKILHRERIDGQGRKVCYDADIKDIPDGTFINVDNTPFLVTDRSMYAWSPFDYGERSEIQKGGRVTVLTPRSIVNAFRAGYVPQMTVFSNK